MTLTPATLTPDWQTEDGSIRLFCGDCLDVLPTLEAGSVDAVVTDLPYGTTQNEWDSVIPLEDLWPRLQTITKHDAPIVTTAAQPFTTTLVASAPSLFRYAMVWDKVNKFTDFLNAPRRPMRRHEDVLVFCVGAPTYNPQMVPVRRYRSRRSQPSRASSYGKVNGCDYGSEISEHNPSTVIAIEAHSTAPSNHPNEKPLALFEYLVLTYSNADDMLLDCAAGSGTTGVACIRTGRKFIGIEKEEKYFRIAVKRITEELSRNRLFEPPPKFIQKSLMGESP